MQQKTFLSLAAAIALAVGAVAVLFPSALLASKGTLPSAAAALVRNHADSPTMCVLMLGNLLVTEVLGYASGVITLLSGLVHNAVLHVVLAAGFAYYWRRGGRAVLHAYRFDRRWPKTHGLRYGGMHEEFLLFTHVYTPCAKREPTPVGQIDRGNALQKTPQG